jgi:hypothetical protein
METKIKFEDLKWYLKIVVVYVYLEIILIMIGLGYTFFLTIMSGLNG